MFLIFQFDTDTNKDPPQVFISYQWDSQDEVKALRDKMEKSGYSCWMDIGQMGGGDFLSAKIDQGIRNCKVRDTTALFKLCIESSMKIRLFLNLWG